MNASPIAAASTAMSVCRDILSACFEFDGLDLARCVICGAEFFDGETSHRPGCIADAAERAVLLDRAAARELAW